MSEKPQQDTTSVSGCSKTNKYSRTLVSSKSLEHAEESKRKWLRECGNVSAYDSDGENYSGKALECWHIEKDSKRSDDIDRWLVAEAAQSPREFQVIIFEDADLSDHLWKQIRLLARPLSEEERRELQEKAKPKLLNLCRELLQRLGEDLATEKTDETAGSIRQKIERLASFNDNDQNDEFYAQIKEIFHPDAFPHMFSECDSNALNSSMERKILGEWDTTLVTCPCSLDKEWDFVYHLDRVFAVDYQPLSYDWLHLGSRITAMNGSLRYNKVNRVDGHRLMFIDMPSSRGSRRKWMRPMLEGSVCVVFVVDLTGHDGRFYSQDSTTKLDNMIPLFSSVISSSAFSTSTVLVVLTNVAAFKKFLVSEPLRGAAFAGYGRTSPEEVVSFIAEMFKGSAKGREDIYSCVAEVGTEEGVRLIVDTVESIVMGETGSS